MKTEMEIRELIEKVLASYRHVLDCGPASVQINAPRALMQVEGISKLSALYDVLGEKRPQFTCDDYAKLDH